MRWTTWCMFKPNSKTRFLTIFQRSYRKVAADGPELAIYGSENSKSTLNVARLTDNVPSCTYLT